MKKKLSPQERLECLTDDLWVEDEFKKRWIWEFLRRNRFYIQDYQKYGKYDEGYRGKIIENESQEIKIMIFNKWNLYRVMPNPDASFDAAPPYCPEPHVPHTNISYFSDSFGEDPISLYRPGAEINYPVKKKFEHWGIYNYRKESCEDLTEDNCPRAISLNISIDPNHNKGDLKKILLWQFEKAYQEVTEAQKACSPFLLVRTYKPNPKLFDKYLQVYDLKKKGKSWKNIALEVYKPKTEKALEKAKETVRKHYAVADYMINKGGWLSI